MRLLPLSLSLALAVAAPLSARETPTPAYAIPAHGVIGVEEAQLSADYWVARLPDADRVVLDTAAIAVQNARLLQLDDSMHDLAALPATLDRTQVAAWVGDVSTRPSKPLYDERGDLVTTQALDAIVANAAPGAIPAQQAPRYGLVTDRADLRAFPTRQRVFSTRGDTDIDRFQESGLFPGEPVAVVHASADGQWWFVVSPRYAAWIEKRHVAIGERAQVLAYAAKTPYRLVTDAMAHTVFTPEQPALSQLQLDMGTRVPVAGWPADMPVNGQHPYTSYVIELPVRGDDGALQLLPALLPRREGSAAQPLPLTKANLLRQAFKFLGERYGWGHSYNARDCSGFVSEVYRSLGVQLPRNTSDQAVSPALNRIALSDQDDRARRMQLVRELQVGDLVYIPGHVMMVIGQIDGAPYVIHDTTGLSYRGRDGTMARARTNGVTVSPLLPLMFNDRQSYVDRITNIQRIRP